MPTELIQPMIMKPDLTLNPIKDPFPVNEAGIPAPAADRIARLAVGPAMITQSDQDSFKKISDDLMRTGTSEDLANIVAEEEALYKDDLRSQADEFIRDPFLSLEQKQQKILDLMEQPSTTPSMRLRFLRQFAQAAAPQTTGEAETQRTLMDVFGEMQHYNSEFEKYKIENVHFDNNTVTDFMAAINLPGSYAPQLVDVIRQALPDVTSGLGPLDNILVGELKQATKDYLTTLTPKERFEAQARLIDAIDKNEFFGADNGFIKWDLMNSLFDNYQDSEWQARFEDIMGIADYFAFFEAIRLGKFAVKSISKGEKPLINGEITLENGHKVKIETSEEQLRNIIQKEYERVFPEMSKDSIASLVAQADQKDLSGVLWKALVNKDEATLKELGVDFAQVTKSTMLPRAADEPMDVAPNLDPIVASVDSFDVRNMAITAREADEVDSGFRTRLGDLAAETEVIHTNKSYFESTPYGYKGRVVIGPNGGDGYKNKKLADLVIQRAQTWFQGDADVRLLARDYADGEFKYYEDVPAENLGPINQRQYLVEVNGTHVYTAEDALAEDLILDSGYRGRIAKWMDKSSYLPQWLVNATNQAEAQFNRRRINLNKMLNPLTKMVRNDQAKVMAVIEEGMRFENKDGSVGKWWTDEELLTKWESEGKNAKNLLAGYQAFRRHQDEAWALINDEVRKNLNARGMKHVTIKGADPVKEDFIGAPLTEIPGNVRRVYDAKLGKVRNITEDEIKQIKESRTDGSPYFIRLSSPLEGKGSWINYVLANDDKIVKVNRLPSSVVRQQPGQVARVYDAAYVLRRKVLTSIDGNPPTERWVTVRIYNNKIDAEIDKLRHLEEAGVDLNDPQAIKDSGYDLFRSNELENEMDYAARDNTRFLEQTGALFTSPRGTEKVSLDGSSVLRPVGESIRAIQLKAARIGTMDIVVRKMQANMNKSYGDLFVLDNDGNIPLLGKAERNPQRKSITDDLRWEKAVAARDYLKLIAGIDDFAVKEAWGKTIEKVADKAASVAGAERAAAWNAGVLQLRNKDPMNLPKMINFTRFMVLNPIRQLFLQTHQGALYTGLEGARKYWFTGQGFTDLAGMLTAAAFRDTEHWAKARKFWASKMKMSEDEYEQMFDNFRRSGLWDEIDSHQYVSGAIFEADLLKADEKAWRNYLGDTYDTTLNMLGMMRAVGFDFGENLQLLGGYLTFRNRWKLQNPKKALLADTPESVKEIAGVTRQGALNMNRSGSLVSQRNALSLAAQFASFGQKTLQLLLPTQFKAGAKGFITNAEKRRIMVNQALLFGGEAFGATKLVDATLEELNLQLPPDVLMAMYQGVYGTLFNVALRVATGEEIFQTDPEDLQTDVNISHAVAPTSAIFGGGYQSTFNNIAGRVYDTFVLGDRDVLAFAFGPTAQLFRDVTGVAQEASYLFGINGKGIDITLPENQSEAFTVIDSVARKFFPAYNSYARYMIEKAHGALSDRFGDPTVASTDAEIFVRNLLGAEPTRAIRLRELKQSFQPSRNQIDPLIQPNSEKLDDIAATTYDIIVKALNQATDGKMTTDEVVDVIANNMEVWKAVLPEHEYFYMNNRFGQLIRNRFNDRGDEFEIIDLVTRVFGTGSNKGDLNETITRIQNMPEFKYKKEALELLNYWRGN